jgi:hypothetical protein
VLAWPEFAQAHPTITTVTVKTLNRALLSRPAKIDCIPFFEPSPLLLW